MIIPEEIRELHDYGVAKIYSPEDGQKLGLVGMIADMIASLDSKRASRLDANLEAVAVAIASPWHTRSRRSKLGSHRLPFWRGWKVPKGLSVCRLLWELQEPEERAKAP